MSKTMQTLTGLILGCSFLFLFNIDYRQMGVGGDNSWGLPVLDKYLIKPGNYSYSFILQSVSK